MIVGHLKKYRPDGILLDVGCEPGYLVALIAKSFPDLHVTGVAIAYKIVQRAKAAGIPREDIMIDCLAFAVGADTSSGLVTLETIRRVKAELGVNLTLSASNISLGLPDRDVINYAFVAIVLLPV